jgi:hypothetical protein
MAALRMMVDRVYEGERNCWVRPVEDFYRRRIGYAISGRRCAEIYAEPMA